MNVIFFSFVFLVGLFIAGALPPAVSENALKIQGQLTILGLLILLGFPFYRSIVLKPLKPDAESNDALNLVPNLDLESHIDPNIDSTEKTLQNSLQKPFKTTRKPFSTQEYLLRLFGLQAALFYISLLFFYTLECMTRWNSRLQPLKEGQLFEILESDFLQLSYLPWVLYAVMGVGLAYFTLREERYPTLPKVILPKPKGRFQHFFNNYLHVVVDAVMLGPFIWLLPLCMIWFCEGLNNLSGHYSLFEYPIRSIFILGLLCLYFSRSHRQLLEQMDRLKIPLGTMLVIYVLMGALLIFLLHAISSWFIAALGNPETKVAKSLIAQSLTEEMQERRLSILIWSWWMLWLPWMASQIARLSVGRKLWVACLASLILPTVFYVCWQQGAGPFHWNLMQTYLPYTAVKFLMAFGILVFLFLFFRQVYSVQDFAKGGMLAFGSRRRCYSLKKWMHGLVVLMAGHMIALFMMGWLSVQILSTLGALVMLTVLFGFIWVLLSSKDFLSAVKKYKVLGKSLG